jgi:hypothetical protein
MLLLLLSRRLRLLAAEAAVHALSELRLHLVSLGALIRREQLVDLRLHTLALHDQVRLRLRLLVGDVADLRFVERAVLRQRRHLLMLVAKLIAQRLDFRFFVLQDLLDLRLLLVRQSEFSGHTLAEVSAHAGAVLRRVREISLGDGESAKPQYERCEQRQNTFAIHSLYPFVFASVTEPTTETRDTGHGLCCDAVSSW